MKHAFGIVQWCKNHLVGTTLGALAILYVVYETLSGVFVYSRDAYVTTDVILHQSGSRWSCSSGSPEDPVSQ
jgi:hypothetical protein